LFKDFMMMSLLTGARRANVQAMMWLDVNVDRGTWRIPSTKTGEAVTVPLCPEAVEILRRRQKLAGGQWVFPSAKSSSGHYVEPQRAWRGLLKRARITDLRLHDLRRTLGSWQAATGANLPVIGKTLGHKHQSTTAIYARLDLDPVRQAVNRATEAMFRAGEKKQA
jgi:integrase